MNWNSWADFVAMGGYGLYVWGSFGMVAVTLLVEMLQLRQRRQALLNDDDMHAHLGATEVAHEGQN